MTPDDVREAVARIARAAEHANVHLRRAAEAEQGFYEAVLGAIAAGAAAPDQLAAEALKTAELDFPRWGA